MVSARGPIAALFADKYDAYCEYKTENGWFTFRLARRKQNTRYAG